MLGDMLGGLAIVCNGGFGQNPGFSINTHYDLNVCEQVRERMAQGNHRPLFQARRVQAESRAADHGQQLCWKMQ